MNLYNILYLSNKIFKKLNTIYNREMLDIYFIDI